MLEDITKTLGAIQQPGSFATRRFAGVENLGLEVKDVGAIRFPISAAKARKLRGVARQAGFGWRDKTLVDKEIRDTWEIARSRVQIDQRRWRETLDPQLKQIQQDLGLPADGKLMARLYKMLVYGPGQFFVPHQDSEKVDDMVGTLTVVLPSACKGGAAIVEHRGEKVTYRASIRDTERLTFIAFYADCRHEVRPVQEGYRIVLVYNLFFDGPAPSSIRPDDVRSVNTLARHVDAHFATRRRSSSYSNEPARYRTRRYSPYDDEGEKYEQEDPGSLELIELIDYDIELRHWINASGKSMRNVAGGVSRVSGGPGSDSVRMAAGEGWAPARAPTIGPVRIARDAQHAAPGKAVHTCVSEKKALFTREAELRRSQKQTLAWLNRERGTFVGMESP